MTNQSVEGEMKCHHCNSGAFQKNGSYKGVQRYLCKSCGRSFTSRGERTPREKREQALDMYLNNVGIRKTARFVKVSPATVVKWVKAAGRQLAGQLQTAAVKVTSDLPDIIEMDEIYTFVQKNSGGQSFGLLIAGGKLALLPMKSAKVLRRP